MATSGTTGAPIHLYLTAHDLERLAVCEAYTFAAAGFTGRDIVQLCVTMDNLFMAGLAYYLGLQRLGCAVLRQGPANPARQLALLERNQVTGIVTVPSFLNALSKEWDRQRRGRDALRLKRAVLVGENIRTPALAPNAIARSIARNWNVQLYGNYGNSEMHGSMGECRFGCGCHVYPDLVHAEIVDPAGRPLPPGEPGLLVVTPLRLEGTPLIRYRTGDIACLLAGPCRCGRTGPRLGPILAREGQMLKVKGTKLYPSAVIDALHGIGGIEDFAVVADRDDHLADRLTVRVALAASSRLTPKAISDRLYARLRVHPVVQCASREDLAALTLPPGYRKKRVFIDQRPALE
jgi:phenylacetate-CoA ligase